jgi:hypothetical protein
VQAALGQAARLAGIHGRQTGEGELGGGMGLFSPAPGIGLDRYNPGALP